MMYGIARVLQFIGLVVLPLACAGNAAELLTLKEMLLMAGTGIVIFYLGVQLQKATKK